MAETDAMEDALRREARTFRLLADGRSHGLGEVAEAAGCTPEAARECLRQLEDMGLQLELRPASVRLGLPVTPLDGGAIRRRLQPPWRERFSPVEVAFSVDSTNTRLAERAGNALRPQCLLAEHQSAGRGRGGRSWFSPLGCNLYVSVHWPFISGRAPSGCLSIGVAQALAARLHAQGAEVGVKWPNDLYCNGRKLAGILLESRLRDDGGWSVIVGIGLNYRLPPGRVPADIPRAADYLSIVGSAGAADRNTLAAAVIEAVGGACESFQAEGARPIVADWHRWDAFPDQPVLLDGADGPDREGVARGIDSDGCLLVETASGHVAVPAGDVTYRALVDADS